MNFVGKLLNFWDVVRSIGVKENPKAYAIFSLMNQICFMGSLVCLAMVGLGILLQLPTYYIWLTLILTVTVSLPLLSNAYQLFDLSRFIVAGIIPVQVCFWSVLIGGSFSEESILTVILFIIYILYADAPKKRIVFYTVLFTAYITSRVYLIFYPSIFPPVDNPYDDPLAFMVCVGWLIMVIWSFQKKIKKQQDQQDQLIQALQEKNANLEKTKEELEQFTYIASHDLKSPLRTIISFLDLIKRDVKREHYDDLSSKLDFARSGAEQMNYLVTDILEYSKITNTKAHKKNMVNLQTIIDKVRFNLKGIIERKGVDLYVFDLPEFYCNETEMTVLFQNFIENGIKYNEEKTPNIFIKSKLTEEYLELQFIDNGIGIEEQYFEKIFLFFKRLHTNDHYKGTGLGLGLCKKIIDDMEGTVEIESMINVGTTFTIRLPNVKPKMTEQPGVNAQVSLEPVVLTSRVK
jgi:signal transduction histidine kinase